MQLRSSRFISPRFHQDLLSHNPYQWYNQAKFVLTCNLSNKATSSLLSGVVGCDDYFLSWMGVKSRVGSYKLVDEDVGVLVEDLIGLAHLRIVENVVLLVPPGVAPVMSAFHRPLVDYCSQKSVFLASEFFSSAVEYGFAVLYFLIVDCLEAV